MSYVLDNAAGQTQERFRNLEALYRPTTVRQLDAVGVAPGWRCWEIGTGSGSVAWQLAARGAQVWATDIDLRWIAPGLADVARVQTHDVTKDEPPRNDFDLIHARLVLSHLPNGAEVLHHLAGCLAPGGWLVVEELDPMGRYFPDASSDAEQLINQVGDAFTAVLGSRGGNPKLGRRLHREMWSAGLVNVSNEGTAIAGTGDSPAAMLMAANVAQMADELKRQCSQLSDVDLDAYQELMHLSTTDFYMPTFWSARGQRP